MKIFNCAICGILAILSVTILTAQELPDIVPPSPMAYEITRYDAQQPDLYTGTAAVSIPLYTIDFDGWRLPLSLSYRASGITTNQEATEVGLGWALNATGVISRTIQSLDDLKNTGQNDRRGYVYSSVDHIAALQDYSSLPANDKQVYYREALKKGVIDIEPDLFNYNFFGFSGTFSLTRKAITGNVDVVKHNVDGVKVVFDEPGSSFLIITPTGFRGVFSIKERTTHLSGSHQVDDLGIFSTYLSGTYIDFERVFSRGNYRPITSWYLERIISPSGKEILFTYNIDENEDSQHVSITSPLFSEVSKTINGNTVHYNLANRSFSKTVTEHVYQTGITVPGELAVTFTMEERQDIARNHVRTEMFPPFIQDPDPDQTHSLPLQRYTGMNITGLHDDSSFSKNIQLKQSYFNLSYLHDHSATYEKHQYLRGRLDEVIIDDQSHKFLYDNGIKGLPFKSTLAMDHQGYYNGKDDNDIIWDIRHGWNFDQISKSLFDYDGNPQKRYYYFHPDRLPDLGHAVAGTLTEIIYPTGGNSKFTYELHDFYGSGSIGPRGYREFLPAMNSNGDPGNVKAGGLRIHTIETRANAEAESILKGYTYIEDEVTNSISSGRMLKPLVYTGYVFNVGDPDEFHVINRNIPLAGLNTASGRHIGYDRVLEVLFTDDKTIKSEYIFDNHKTEFRDYIPERKHNTHVSTNNYRNGSLISKNDYKDYFTKVAENKNTYTEYVEDVVRGIRYTTPGFNGTMPLLYNYEIPVVRYNVATSVQKLNFEGSYLNKETSYVYDYLSQIKETTTKDSRGKNLCTVNKRIGDYTQNQCIPPSSGSGCMHSRLINRNLVSNVLESVQYANNTVVAATGYKYDLEHGNIVLRKVYRFNKALGPFSPSVNGFDFDNSYELVLTFDDYDADGNLLQVTPKDGVPVSYIWGYNKEYPIAKGENITHADLLAAYNATKDSANYQQAIREYALVSNAMITTYSYDPLVGLIEGVDADGRTTYYEYDEYSRLRTIKDLDQNIVSKNYYGFKKPTKEGGLEAANTLSFGVVNPGVSLKKFVTINNTGNYGITINDLVLPDHFSSTWDNKTIFIPANGTFELPVVFHSPSSPIGNYQADMSVLSDDVNGPLVITLHAIGQITTVELTTPQDCYLLGYDAVTQSNIDFDRINVQFKNTGNSPLYFRNINIDDDRIHHNYHTRYTRDPFGDLVVDPYVIYPNSTLYVDIQLVSPGYNNWDNYAQLHMVYFEGASLTLSPTIELTRDPNYCNNNGGGGGNTPPFTVSGNTTADCSSGMSGTITVNSGSIRVVSSWNMTSGTNFIGATITIDGVGQVNTSGTIITPNTYPATYTFSSGASNCSTGFGNTTLQVYQH